MLLIATGMFSFAGYSTVIQVGPGQTYPNPAALSDANLAQSSVVQDGDIIEIHSGEYLSGEINMWLSENDLIIRGVGPTKPLLNNEWTEMNESGIFVISGDNVQIENIYFAGGKNWSANGAGIRHNGGDLTVRDCRFYFNQMGLQCTSDPAANILVENCEFDNNGHVGTGMSHHIYINNLDQGTFTLKYSYLHDVHNGNSVKSKCAKNYIMYNRITNENANGSSLIDLPRGGLLICIGNLIQKNSTPNGMNRRVIAYASEQPNGTAWTEHHPIKEVHIVNNTVISNFYNQGPTKFLSAIFNSIQAGQITNNVLIGEDMVIGEGYIYNMTLNNNYIADFAGGEGLMDPANFDYDIEAGSILIDGGIDPGYYESMSLTPEFQYVHMHDSEARPTEGTLDIGAYEFEVVVEDPGVSIDENDEFEIKVYPNPTVNHIIINVENDELLGNTFKVIDQTGRIILEGVLESNQHQVDFSAFAKGIYNINVAELSQILRVVKQ